MKKRTASKPAEPVKVTEEEMRMAFGFYISAYCDLQKIDARTSAKIERLKLAADKRQKPLKETLETQLVIVQRWADQNKERFTTQRKIEVYGGHRIGYQTSPPAVKYCKPTEGKGTQTEKGFIAACKAVATWIAARRFIRIVEAPNKEEILRYHRRVKAASEHRGTPSLLETAERHLADLGIKVNANETFVVDLDLVPTETANVSTEQRRAA